MSIDRLINSTLSELPGVQPGSMQNSTEAADDSTTDEPRAAHGSITTPPRTSTLTICAAAGDLALEATVARLAGREERLFHALGQKYGSGSGDSGRAELVTSCSLPVMHTVIA
eukprot:6172592-Prymnesium_polylepis.2